MNQTTITSALESIWADQAMPIIIAALAVSGPIGAGIAAVLKIPIVGAFLTRAINWLVDKLIVAGVITVKIGILEYLSIAAKAKYALQITALLAAQSQDSLTPEQEAAYESALQGIVQNHPGTVNS
jgi:hypothetical protein